MRWIRNIGLGLVLIVVVNACFTPPDFPITPQIEFINNELKFIKNPAPQGNDTLRIVLKFKDGDGDVGIIPVNPIPLVDREEYFYLLNSNGQLSLIEKEQSNLTFRFKRLNPNFRLPNGKPLPELSCDNWSEKKVNNRVVDTIYYELNPRYYNMSIEYFTKNNNGTFTRFDIKEGRFFPNCADGAFNGARIPNLSKEIGKSTPLDGKITFNYLTQGIDFIFSIKTLKLKVYIVDRAGNKSNEVESKEFTLQSIRGGG
ncbi:MAG: hypothetical protein HOP37_14930 [Cyclobacteriaceae bacterium]|nr:hypothetical protein [Cyclobacteriaceae bacterium]